MPELKKYKTTELQDHFFDPEINQSKSKKESGTVLELVETKAVLKAVEDGWFVEVISLDKADLEKLNQNEIEAKEKEDLQKKISDLFEMVKEFDKSGNYSEAKEGLSEILKLDPENKSVKKVLNSIDKKIEKLAKKK